jgi:hypothetical protein
MFKDRDGEWIKWDDHEAEVQALRAKLEEAEAREKLAFDGGFVAGREATVSERDAARADAERLKAAYWCAMTEIEAFDYGIHKPRHIEGWCGVCEMMERITSKHGRPAEPLPLAQHREGR